MIHIDNVLSFSIVIIQLVKQICIFDFKINREKKPKREEKVDVLVALIRALG